MNQRDSAEAMVAQAWDQNANVWADHVRRGWDVYRDYFNNPAFFSFTGDVHGKDVLDAGCGEGTTTRELARIGARVTGIDLSPEMIGWHIRRSRTHRLAFVTTWQRSQILWAMRMRPSIWSSLLWP